MDNELNPNIPNWRKNKTSQGTAKLETDFDETICSSPGL